MRPIRLSFNLFSLSRNNRRDVVLSLKARLKLFKSPVSEPRYIISDSLGKLPFPHEAYSYLRDQKLVILSADETKAESPKSLLVIGSAELWDDNIESTKFLTTDDASRHSRAGNVLRLATGKPRRQ